MAREVEDDIGLPCMDAPRISAKNGINIGEVLEMINPRMLEASGSQNVEEGCLSVPGYVGKVERPEYIKIEALDRSGNKVIHEGADLKAVAISHELDHLEGILYTDKATDVHEIDADPEEE